ncbi:MAG: type II toxin-antitoxin system RelE/ParE family toxin [Proteobacteria bacterium]|nr:type II toxin-antitoxin system RelE/ParE family toxin [Pseudomonadota bacterium]
MANRVVFAPEAEAQLVSIHRYIAGAAGPAAAFAFTTAIVDDCESFTTFPRRGTRRDDLRRGLRTIGFRRRVTIAFDVVGETVSILGIFYGGQDVEGALRRDDEQ